MISRRIAGKKAACALIAVCFLQGAGYAADADAQDVSVWLLCQFQGGNISCTRNQPITQVQGRHLVPIRMPPPEFPQHLRNRGLEGCVTVGFSVVEAGQTTDIKVLQTMHQGQFDAAAQSAVRQYRFHPLQNPVESVAVRVCFSLR